MIRIEREVDTLDATTWATGPLFIESVTWIAYNDQERRIAGAYTLCELWKKLRP